MESAHDVLLPRDYGRVEDCWWLVTKVVDQLESLSMRPTLNKIQVSLDEQVEKMHRRRKGRDFFFSLGYSETLEGTLGSMVDLGILKVTNSTPAYFLTDAGKEVLGEHEPRLRELGYSG